MSEYSLNLREAITEVSNVKEDCRRCLRANQKTAEAKNFAEMICRLIIVNEYPQNVVTVMGFRE